ncbi:hypothetical protein [Saccharothrix hoggarensis]|uniref:Uncharacterized protein n=1 Tax=Saccharothrix hoggarensis TaxID=913853 RepID=A0ABW3QTA9_9PSEU
MKLEILYKDPASGSGCPTVYLAESGEFVVQGPEVDAATKDELVSVVPGETAVRLAPEVLLSAALRYVDRGRDQRAS